MRPKRKPLTDADGNVRELTTEDFTRMKRFDELPKDHQDALRRAFRGPQKAPTKQQVTLRLSPEVLEHYRAGGRGWQTRIDRTLVNAVKKAGRVRSMAASALTVASKTGKKKGYIAAKKAAPTRRRTRAA